MVWAHFKKTAQQIEYKHPVVEFQGCQTIEKRNSSKMERRNQKHGWSLLDKSNRQETVEISGKDYSQQLIENGNFC